MERLVAVLFRHRDVVFNPALERGVELVDNPEREVTGRDVVDDDAKRGEIVDFAHVLVVFREFFVERIDGFDTTGEFKIDFFLF